MILKDSDTRLPGRARILASRTEVFDRSQPRFWHTQAKIDPSPEMRKPDALGLDTDFAIAAQSLEAVSANLDG